MRIRVNYRMTNFPAQTTACFRTPTDRTYARTDRNRPENRHFHPPRICLYLYVMRARVCVDCCTRVRQEQQLQAGGGLAGDVVLTTRLNYYCCARVIDRNASFVPEVGGWRVRMYGHSGARELE